MDDALISLSKAAQLLGVHPSTVRLWSDQGKLPVYRTSGGHRRFRSGEVESWKQAQTTTEPVDLEQLAQHMLTRIRLKLEEAPPETETWYLKLDNEAREHYRHSGRALSQGLAQSMSVPSRQAVSQAWGIGRDYAVYARKAHLGRMEAIRAFLYFRNALIDSLVEGYQDAGKPAIKACSEILHHAQQYTDQVLIALLEGYEYGG